ncbi:hypothetical protein HOLleu_10857 [Holothuria leucospilota]|uniref:Peptidase aspartic putative domain-containing protein n=1 Tax=Holothuria leucospilota TaxID=206669 RepID=A0A9Q1CE49_HOLLE|nr:hypothetical protein HOLleu_10857 [Holothuria leucospilota]
MVYTRDELNIDGSNIPTQADEDIWPNLAGLTIPEVNIDDISILIGQDCPEALMPLDIRNGPKGSPFAIRTQLGWVINGPMDKSTRRRVSVNFVEVNRSLEVN